MTLTRRELLGSALITWSGSGNGAWGQARSLALYGRDETAPAAIELRAGPVTAMFEPEIGFLRYVRYGDRELLRGMYAAVRDKVWGTVRPRIRNVVLENRGNAFKLTFEVECKQDDIDFPWHGVITGDAAGTVRFEMNGTARSTFLKNRLGFAILHPLKECAGQPCMVETVDGKVQNGRFPDTISPHQPFFNIRSITHSVQQGLQVQVRMEGDTFEMEDHRNWTDANFKTYCTPLGKPYPVEVKAGTPVRQSVTVRLIGKPEGGKVRVGDGVDIRVNGELHSRPATIGSAWTGTDPDANMLKMSRLAHTRVDLRLWEAGWQESLRSAARLGLPLEAAVFATDNADQEFGRVAAAAKGVRVARWLVFHQKESSTREQWLRVARKRLPGGAPIGGGSNVYFTELNRERPATGAIDVACYSVNPQVHAFDNQTLMENLSAQADTVRSAMHFLNGKPVAVTPVTLRPRFNPQAVGPSGAPAASRVDPRQKSLLAAAWTLGSVKYLSEAGASSATYYEMAGPAGLMEGRQTFPLFHVLADVNEYAGAEVAVSMSSDPLRVVSLAMDRRGERRLMLANLTPTLQVARLWDGWLGRRVTLRRLDEHSFQDATTKAGAFRGADSEWVQFPSGRLDVALMPYGVVTLDGYA
ncbi:MAG: hypothetical protein IT168_00245 [Bryobacterales bacterium]|nr:hypothetical protein [Bryobacterales bacterium]